MAATLATSLTFALQWLYEDALDLGSVKDANRLTYSGTLATGTGSSLADRLWHDSRSILTTADDDLDLTALTQSIYGSTVTTNLAKMKILALKVTTTTAGVKLVLQSDVTNGYLGPFNSNATSEIVVGPNSPLLIANIVDGFGATSGTNKIIRINNPGGSTVAYSIAIIGTSA